MDMEIGSIRISKAQKELKFSDHAYAKAFCIQQEGELSADIR